MAVAIKHVPNLPSYPCYVYTLPNITQKPKHDINELKQRLIDTWDCIPQGINDETSDKRGCVHA